LEILKHAPQLGDVRSALQSVVFAHEEQNNVRLAFVFRESNVPTVVCGQVELGSRGTYFQVSAHKNLLFRLLMRV
jgi:hypothetical protein